MHQNYFRDFDPSTGGYIQPDPLGLAGDINLYCYARNNSVAYFDPDGRQAAAALGGGAVSSGAGAASGVGSRELARLAQWVRLLGPGLLGSKLVR